MTVEAGELSGGALAEMSAPLDASTCVHHGTEGVSGSSHFIKSLCSLLVFSWLCWLVSFNERDVNVIQQGYRDTGPCEDDGIGRKLMAEHSKKADAGVLLVGEKKKKHFRCEVDVILQRQD